MQELTSLQIKLVHGGRRSHDKFNETLAWVGVGILAVLVLDSIERDRYRYNYFY